MAKEPTIDELFLRFETNVKKEFYPFLIVSVLDKLGEASGDEIRQEISDISGKDINSSYTSFYNLMGRMKKTFGLIKPTGSSKNAKPEQAVYELTEKGKELYDRCIEEVVLPLNRLLPRE